MTVFPIRFFEILIFIPFYPMFSCNWLLKTNKNWQVLKKSTCSLYNCFKFYDTCANKIFRIWFLIINFYLNYYWWTYENVMFQISSKSGNKWRILRLGGGQNSFWGSQGGQNGPISENRKILMQNGGLNPQPKFQHSSWIRKCLKIGDFWGGFRPLKGGRGARFQKF